MAYLQSRVASCRAELERNESALGIALTKENEAAEAERRAKAAADTAADDYANDQTPEAGRALLDAREALALATAAHEARVRARVAAENAASVARSALEDAQAKAEAERIAMRKAELLPLANPSALTEKVAPHFARVLEIEREAQAAIEAELDKVAEAFDATNAASKELRDLGERAIVDVGGHTIALAAVRALLETGEFEPQNFSPMDRSLGGPHPIWAITDVIDGEIAHGISSRDVLRSLFAGKLVRLRVLAGTSNRISQEIEAELSAMRSARTRREAFAAIEALPHRQPAPMPSHGQAVFETRSTTTVGNRTWEDE